MGSLRLTLCTGSVLAAALAPTACAADAGVSVTPSLPAPGGDIQVHARGCAGRAGTASSEAFVADAVLTGRGGALAGETRVRTSARPGTYRIRITCDGVEGGTGTEAALTVRARAVEKGSGVRASGPRPSTTPRTAHASPVAPVRAGGGGAAHLLAAQSQEADARDDGPGFRQAVVGLLLVSMAALAVALRGARRSRVPE